MSGNKLLYIVVTVAFIVYLLVSNLVKEDVLQINCSEIVNTKITQKKVSKPYLRTIDVLEVELRNEVFLVQSNDDNIVRDLERELRKCQGGYDVSYYRKEQRGNDEVFFIKKSFFE